MKPLRVSSPTFSILKRMRYFNNLIVFFLMLCGMFVIYKYVKSLEKELKHLTTTVQHLSNSNNNNADEVCVLNSCNIHSVDGHQDPIIVSSGDDQNDDEDESVHSDEIYNMIHGFESADEEAHASGEGEDNETSLNDPTEEDDEEGGGAAYVSDEDVEEVEESAAKVANDDDITFVEKVSFEDPIELTHNSLSKLKNEALKKILKEQGQSTHGSKSQLIERILLNSV